MNLVSLNLRQLGRSIMIAAGEDKDHASDGLIKPHPRKLHQTNSMGIPEGRNSVPNQKIWRSAAAPVIIAFLQMTASCGLAHRADVEIVVPASAEDRTSAAKIVPPASWNSDLNSRRVFSWTPDGKGLSSLFGTRDLRKITVLRYISNNQLPQSRESVKTLLMKLTLRNSEDAPLPMIMWAEETRWSIEAKLEFSAGPALTVFTNGLHLCIVDEDGQPWFSRMLIPPKLP